MITPNDTIEKPDSAVGVLLSGGLDSSILVGRILEQGKRVVPFFIRSGLVWQREELVAVERFLAALRGRDWFSEDNEGNEVNKGKEGDGGKEGVKVERKGVGGRLAPLVVLDLPLGDLYDEHWSTTGKNTPLSDSEDQAVYMPGRNGLLVIKAAIWCRLHGVSELCLGLLGTSPFEDAGADFFENLEDIVNSGDGGGVRLVRPFAAYNKVDVMRLGKDLPLELTFSCISPLAGLHCGRCNKCAERIEAFRAAGMDDPTEYDQSGKRGPHFMMRAGGRERIAGRGQRTEDRG